MSMLAIDIAVRVYRELEPEDIEILQAIEEQKKNYEHVPLEATKKQTQLAPQEIEYRLPILVKKDLVQDWRGAYVGYNLTTAGYDTLAINAFVKAEAIEAFGKPLGVGKESDVYDALTPTKQRVAIKFHRLGRTSFKQTKRKRDYTINYSYSPNWHQQSRIAAKKEYKALKLLYPKGIAVPKPINQNRHVLVMSMIEGTEIYRHTELQNPQAKLEEILVNVRKAYREVHIVHGDLSPYNIILQPNQHILIIDWPQSVTTKHRTAKNLLKRDLKNIVTFFKRKHRLKNKLEDTLDYVTKHS